MRGVGKVDDRLIESCPPDLSPFQDFCGSDLWRPLSASNGGLLKRCFGRALPPLSESQWISCLSSWLPTSWTG